MSDVNPIPEGYHTLTPHIVVNDTKAALEFYNKAFGGETLFTMPGPDGKSIMHAEVQIGDSRLRQSTTWYVAHVTGRRRVETLTDELTKQQIQQFLNMLTLLG